MTKFLNRYDVQRSGFAVGFSRPRVQLVSRLLIVTVTFLHRWTNC